MTLRTALSDYLARESQISPPPADTVWAANGSNEVMQHLFQAFGGPGRTALSFSPHYSMYSEYARTSLTTWVAEDRGPAPKFELDANRIVAAIQRHRPALLLLTSPNNPTGTALDLDSVRAAAHAQSAHGGLVIVDEAYAEFRRDGVKSALSVIDDHPNLVVSRTMSKAFAFAGARVGYLVAHPAIVQAVELVRLPYHLSAITQTVALTALAHADELLGHVEILRTERDQLAEHLRHRGYDVAPSDANFLLVGTFADRRAVWEGLLERSVLIRETGPDGWLRVSVGTPHDNQAFKAALKEIDPR